LQLFSIEDIGEGEFGDPIQNVKKRSIKEEYGRTKLFKGNLPILLTFYLQSCWTADEIALIQEGTIGLILRGYITYADGFSTEASRTEFFFDYHAQLDAWTTGNADYGDFIGDDDE
jgi:hypothetical protein